MICIFPLNGLWKVRVVVTRELPTHKTNENHSQKRSFEILIISGDIYRVSQKMQPFWSWISQKWFSQINCPLNMSFSIAIQFYQAFYDILERRYWVSKYKYNFQDFLLFITNGELFYLYNQNMFAVVWMDSNWGSKNYLI